MRQIYTIGETVMDILFRGNEPVTAKAGGSMLNASVTLGRLKMPVNFISEFGVDRVGDIINDFLASNNVNTQYVYRYSDGKSALALAFLDEQQKADYNFYKIYPEKRLNIETPPISKSDIVMFGSYFGIASEIRPTLMQILTKAKECGAIIIYDPNFRKAHLHQLKELMPVIRQNFELADIIKGSDEDFFNIFSANSAKEAFKCLEDNSKILVYTVGSGGVYFCSSHAYFHVPAKSIEPVSTIGAGDNFSAGLAFGLLKYEASEPGIISEENWKKILNCGIDFASEVCLSYDNYISQNFCERYLNEQTNT